MEKKYNVGDRVVVIEDSEIRKGTISVVVDNSPIVVVRFDNGDVEKCHVCHLAIMPKTESQPEEKTEPTPKSTEQPEITITPNEFRDISVEVAIKLGGDKPMLTMAFVAYSAMLSKALFGTESDD